MTAPTGTELLEREIGAQKSALMNAIICRRDHPSYGYTKKDILERYNQLVGMLYAWQIITTGQNTALIHLAAAEAGVALHVDLRALQVRVAKA